MKNYKRILSKMKVGSVISMLNGHNDRIEDVVIDTDVVDGQVYSVTSRDTSDEYATIGLSEDEFEEYEVDVIRY